MADYAELAVTTNFSFLRGASHGEELVGRAKEIGLAGLGVADRNSVAGVVRAHESAKENGLAFAPGVRLVFADGTPDILAYPQDRAAWGRLTQLLTLGKRRADKGQCLITREDLLAHVAGLNLIVLPGSLKEAAPRNPSFETSAARPPQDDAFETSAAQPPQDDAFETAPSTPPQHEAFGSASSWPGSSRPSTPSLRLSRKQDVDGRDKPGHDEEALSRQTAEPTEDRRVENLVLMKPRNGHPERPHPVSTSEKARACPTESQPFEDVILRRPQSGRLEGWTPAQSLKFLKSPIGRRNELLHLLLILREAAPRAVWLGASMLYRGDDARRLARLAGIAVEARVPLIAVGDVLYHVPERRTLQDVLTCVREHTTLATAGRLLEANAERHLKPPAEMARLFRDAPQAVTETLRFLEGCRFSLEELRYEYPDETREGFATPQHALVALTEEGARQRYPNGVPAKVRTALDHEFALVDELSYAPYFLTVHDIVRFARSRGILCQGRGSAANSVICFCLGITEVDPERVDLLFERFVSAERREPPDIDVDFEHERREDVIQYIYARYGRHRAGLAATVICYRARSAIREVGKAFGLTDDTVGALSGMLWGWSVQSVTETDARRVGLDPADPQLAKALALARALIGFPRHLSQHVGGFVITRNRLDDVVPIENAAMPERTCVEWDKDDLDALGILKIDVLALGMLTCLRRGFDLLNKHYADHPPLEGRASDSGSFTSPLAGEVVRASAQAGEGACHITKAEFVARPLTPALSREGRGRRAGTVINEHPPLQGKVQPFSLAAIPPEEEAVYRMLSRADSIGVFQVESRAQMSMLPRLRPKKFYDLVIEVAIVRPGPIQGDMVHPYLRRRQGIEQVSYPSPSPHYGSAEELERVLGKTLGVPLFQEQAMRIAIVAAGFTPTEADKLRRAMATFRRVGTIKYFRDKLIEGMAGRGYPRDFAERCFRQIEGFGEYGFPESHAASFALLVYASSWMKCRYPDVFAAALLNSQPMGFYAPAQIVRDAREHGIDVRPVDINHSCWDNTLEPDELRPDSSWPGLSRPSTSFSRPLSEQGVDARDERGHDASPPPLGVSSPPPLAGEGREGAASTYAVPRDAPSPPSLASGEGISCPRAAFSVIRRLHPRHGDMARDIRSTHAMRLGFRQISGFSENDGLAIERCRGAGFDSVRDLWLRSGLKPSALERLAAADAFRSLGLDRRQALWAVKALRRAGDKDDLPLFARAASPALEPDVALPPMRIGEHVVEDYRHLHLSLKAHPVSFLRRDLDRRGIVRHERLAAMPSGRRVTVAGLVLVRQRPGSANGVIFMTLEDETAVANTIVWPKIFEIFRPVVLGARLVSVTGKLQNEYGVIHVVADRIDDLSDLLKRLAEDTGCVESLANCDEVKHPIPEWRLPPRAVTSLAALAKEEPQARAPLADEVVPKIRAVMPKGRNFH
jgi:DNA-directed DNA polymerase III PolC